MKEECIEFLKEISLSISEHDNIIYTLQQELVKQYDISDKKNSFDEFIRAEFECEEKKGYIHNYELSMRNLKERLNQKYQEIKIKGKEDAFFEFIKLEYKDEPELFIQLLKYLCEMVRENKPNLFYFQMILQRELINKGDIILLLNVYEQIKCLKFTIGLTQNFQETWDINQLLTQRLMEVIPVKYDKIPLTERDNKLIVILVDQMLSIGHAPTKLVLEICRIIKKMKKRVLLVNVCLKTDAEMLDNLGFSYYMCKNYIEEYNGKSQYQYKNNFIDMYQLILQQENIIELKNLIQEIYKLKPFCVWNFSSIPSIAGIMKQFTTCIYTSMSQGYPAVAADIIVNYIPTKNLQHIEDKKFLEENSIKVMETEFLFPYELPQKKIKLSSWGIPDEGFVVGIVGNRLSGECNVEFMQVLEDIVYEDANIYFVFIGEVSENFKNGVEKHSLNGNNYKFIGYADELIEYLDALNLYINPPRMGGGNSGAMAMAVGKPIITLDDGDVASVAGENFIANTLQDYISLVLKYKNDSIFYEKQSEKALKRISEITTDDEKLAEILQQVFDMIE